MELFSGTSLIGFIQTIGFLGVMAIIFAETGLFVGFFFPGDSLLFTAGLLASRGAFNIYLLIPSLFLASVAGNLVGYYFGKSVGSKIFLRPDSLLFRKEHLERTKSFFTKHGGKTIILARFIPIVRTFAPILAGVSSMNISLFLTHSVIGGALWTIILTILGFILGNTVPNIDHYLLPIVGVIIVLSFVPTLFHARKS